jgi:hypothetical protein
MLILYHGERGWSSLNREKEGDLLDEESDDAHKAHNDKEPKHGHNRPRVDLIFHVYMIPQVGGIYKHKHGET